MLLNHNSKKVLVIGDVMVDHYMHCKCDRISPEAPVPVACLQNDEFILGGAANVANNLVKLGLEVILCGVIGNDSQGTKFNDLLYNNNIGNLLLQSNNRRTTIKSRVVSSGHQLLRIDREDNFLISKYEEDQILDKVESIISQCNSIIISDYDKGLLTDDLLKKIMLIANSFSLPVLIDPKTPPFVKYAGAEIIKPNRREAFLETGIDLVDTNSIKRACSIIFENTRIPKIIITLSEGGVAVFENEVLTIIPTKSKEVFDVTGAGDTFLAALTSRYIEKRELIPSAEFANYAAACVISKMGSATTSVHEILNLINKENNGEN